MADDAIPALVAGAPELPAPMRQVPVTILTGFLGSGKTSLLRHLMTDTQHGKRIAVIQNELGDTAGLDKTMVTEVRDIEARHGANLKSSFSDDASKLDPSRAASPRSAADALSSAAAAEAAAAATVQTKATEPEWIDLDNGCLCCSVKDAGLLALESLLAKPLPPGARPIDHVLIETTGMADPSPIVQSFWVDAELESRVRLDGVVTVVDAAHVLALIAEKDGADSTDVGPIGRFEAVRQIALSDLLILNKTDLLAKPDQPKTAALSRPTRDTLTAALQRLNPTVEIVPTAFGRVDPNTIFSLHAYDEKARNYDVRAGAATDHARDAATGEASTTSYPAHILAHDSTHAHAHAHQAAPPVQTLVMEGTASTPVGTARLEQWLQALLWDPAETGTGTLINAPADEAAPSPKDGMAPDPKTTAPEVLKAYWSSRLRSPTSPQTVLRIKGLLVDATEGTRTIIQAVRELYDFYPLPATDATKAATLSTFKLVLIGPALDAALLRTSFEAMVLTDP